MKPTSEVRREAFAAGYQDALRDVRRIWEDDGSHAALDYVNANIIDKGRDVPPHSV